MTTKNLGPSKPHGRNGSVLLAALLAATALVAIVPFSFGATSASNAIEAGNVQVPKGFPDSDQRYIPCKGTVEFRAFYAARGTETWDGWTGAATMEGALEDATNVLTSSDQYTHAFVENTKTGQVVWTSWNSAE